MFHTVYKIKNNVNQKFYVGTHITDNQDDDYMGSGIAIGRAITKYGIESFDKETLFSFDNPEDMLAMEKLIVDEVLIDQVDCYNMRVGGRGGTVKGWKHSREVKVRIANTLKGRVSPRKGKKMSAHQKKLLSKALSGKKNPMYGRNHSEESKEKMRQSHLNLPSRGLQSESHKKKRGLSRAMYYALKDNNIDTLNKLQKEYFNLFSEYHPKYERFI